MADVYMAVNEKVDSYPEPDDSFSPDICYPEYIWGESFVSARKNGVYELVRECIKTAGYDAVNYGKKTWNPLGDIINPGDTVLIKPNWVDHKNKNKKVNDRLACLVTNPAVVRAVMDYILIALKGKGRIIIADAPMQGCDLKRVFEITGYERLFDFYKKRNADIEVADLRKYSTKGVYTGVMTEPEMTGKTAGALKVDLGHLSLHSEKDRLNPNYKVTDYLQETTVGYHSEGKHEYEINRYPLMADVIINMPKPKTHRLAGMTAGVKNFVGITYDKACLPHRIEGDKEHGADAYLKKSRLKEKMHYFDEKRTLSSVSGSYRKSKYYDILMKICYVLAVVCGKDKYRIGSWYGNDTIWRTAADLNYIIMHADKNGKIREDEQRRILTIGDMVICGQGEGPVGPSPKKLGMIMLSENTLSFDRAVCEIMGFNSKVLPLFTNSNALENMGYSSREELESSVFVSNVSGHNSRCCVKDIEIKEEWKFEPHSCWKGHIERK